MKHTADEIMQKLQMEPHPEGGYYRETYRSQLIIPQKNLAKGFKGDRSCATSIYYLLPSHSFSAFHRIGQDEIWHFHIGSPISLHEIDKDGVYQRITIGIDLSQGQAPQYVVPAGSWFAAEVEVANSFALVSCTVAPGFDFRDFELGDKGVLIKLFPGQAELIARLTRSGV